MPSWNATFLVTLLYNVDVLNSLISIFIAFGNLNIIFSLIDFDLLINALIISTYNL